MIRNLLMPGILAVVLLLISTVQVSAQEVKLPHIKIGHVGHDHHMALFLAADRGRTMEGKSSGYWLNKIKDRHIYQLMKGDAPQALVEVIKVGGGMGMPSSIASAQINLGFGGLAPTVLAIDRGADIKIIAPANGNGDMLVMRPEFKINSWKEFLSYVKSSKKPLRIGYKSPKAVAYLIMRAALEHEKIKYGHSQKDAKGKPVQVQFINLGKGSNMIPALAGRSVDGFVMNQPVVSLAEYKKIGSVVCDLKDLPPPGKWSCHPCCCLAASGKFLKENRNIAAALVGLFSTAAKELNDKSADSSATATCAARWTGKPEAVEKLSMPSILYVSRPQKEWLGGCDIWYSMMSQMNQYKGVLKGKSVEEIAEIVTDYSLYDNLGGCDSK